MRFTLSDKTKTQSLVTTFMTLAYAGCGGTTGMGFLQERNDINSDNIMGHLCRNDVWGQPDVVEVRGDYVAGRMVKTGIIYNEKEGWVEVSDRNPTPDYQGWCVGTPADPGVLQMFNLNNRLANRNGMTISKYGSYEELLRAAATIIDVELEYSAVRSTTL